MALKLIDTYVKPFLSDTEVSKITHLAKASHELVLSREGAGNAFLGWVDLPVAYDKEE